MPVVLREAVGKSLRACQVGEAQEGVVLLRKLDALARERARKRAVAIAVDLQPERCPGRHAQVGQTELVVDEAEVAVQALALSGTQVGAALLLSQPGLRIETAARSTRPNPAKEMCMHHAHRLWAALGSLLAFSAWSTAADAAVVRYVYAGQPFTTATPGYPLTAVSAWFAVDDTRIPINGHVTLDSYNTGGLIDYAFSDGINTISNDPYDGFSVYSSARVSFDTDAQGQVVGNWEAWASRAHGNQFGMMLQDSIGTVSYSTYPPTGLPWVQDSASSLSYAATVFDQPGTWYVASAVPEPAMLHLLLAGLAGLAWRSGRRRNTD